MSYPSRFFSQLCCMPSLKEDDTEDFRLYGRKVELEQLVSTFELHSTRIGGYGEIENENSPSVVLVHGPSGNGKTALLNQLRPLIEKSGGFFLSGKFDCRALQDPPCIFVSILVQLVNELKSRGTKSKDCRHQQIRGVVQGFLGSERKVLTDLVPSLEGIVGVSEDDCEAQAGDATNRLKYALCKFFQAVSTVIPLVIVFDDVQWGDKTSIELILALTQLAQYKDNIFIALACRTGDSCDKATDTNMISSMSGDNDFLKPGHDGLSDYFPCFFRRDGNSSSLMKITSINVGNLSELQVNDLVEGSLQLRPGSGTSLSQLVYRESKGNVLSALQYLRYLTDQGILYRVGQWSWNEHIVTEVMGSTDSVEEIFRKRLNAMSPFTQEMMQVASCMGNKIDETALAIVMNDRVAEISESLKSCADEKMIALNPDRGRFSFIHDRIRQNISEALADIATLSSKVGQAMMIHASAPYLESNVCTIAKLINQNIETISNPIERYLAASLNLEAGRKASSIGEFPDAAEYLNAGIRLLKAEQCWLDNYTLSLSLYISASDVALSNANFSLVDRLVREIQQYAICLDDELPSYVIQMDSLGQQGDLHKALDVGLEVLRLLGEELPDPRNAFAVRAEKMKVDWALKRRSNNDLLLLPAMRNKTKMEVMRVLGTMHFYAYQAGSPYYEIISIRMVWLSIMNGLNRHGAFAFVTYGVIVGKTNVQRAFRLGELALSLVKKTQATDMQAKIFTWMYGCIHHWTRPICESLEPLNIAVAIGMERGDMEFAMTSMYFHLVYSLLSGVQLLEVSKLITKALRMMKMYKQSNAIALTKPVLQFVRNLESNKHRPFVLLIDEASDDEEVTDSSKNLTAVVGRTYYSASLAFLFGEVELADEIMEKRRNMTFHSPAVFRYPVSIFLEGLVAVARVRQGFMLPKNRKLASQALKQLTKWSRHSPNNFHSKRLLLSAEVLSLSGGNQVRSHILQRYSQSIEFALAERFTHEAALAYELLGDYKHRCGDSVQAFDDWKISCQLYRTWGAVAKEQHLQGKLKRCIDSYSHSLVVATNNSSIATKT